MSDKETAPTELQVWASRARAARQQWLESYGVPISNEFAQFAEAIGNLINLAELAAPPQVTPTPAKTRRQYVYDWMSLPNNRVR